MYRLVVIFTFDLEHDTLDPGDPRDAEERAEDIVEYLSTRPGYLGSEIVSLDEGRLTLISSWPSREVADAALNGEHVNAALATRAGAVLQRPDAVGLQL